MTFIHKWLERRYTKKKVLQLHEASIDFALISFRAFKDKEYRLAREALRLARKKKAEADELSRLL